jgi:hypothetical protein
MRIAVGPPIERSGYGVSQGWQRLFAGGPVGVEAQEGPAVEFAQQLPAAAGLAGQPGTSVRAVVMMATAVAREIT